MASRSTSGSTAMPSAAPARVTRVDSPPRFSGTGSGARGKSPSVSRLIPATSQPRRSSSARMTGPPAPRTASSATVNVRARMRSTSTAGSFRTASRCRATAPSSVVTFPVRPHQLLDAGAVHPVQEDPIWPDELERVPFDGVVARRDRDPAPGPVVLDRELHGRRGYEADVDHIAADGLEPGADRGGEHRAGGARIPADDDGRTRPRSPGARPLPEPEPEAPSPAGDDVGSQVFPDDAADARDADHQGVGHADKSNPAGMSGGARPRAEGGGAAGPRGW